MTELENNSGPLTGRKLPERPWQFVALDFKEALPDNKSLLVAIDYFSKYVEIVVMSDTSATETVVALKFMNARYGNPNRYTVDNGPQFDSDVFRQYCAQAGIEIETTTPYKPNMNGEVERFNRNLKKRIQIAYIENQDYREALADYLHSYHNLVHSAIGTTPAMMMFQHEIRDNLPNIRKHSADIIFEEVIENHDYKKKESIDETNRKRKNQLDSLEVGDTVFTKNQGVRPGYVPRFGPTEYRITEKSGSKCTIVTKDHGKKLVRDASHLKKIPDMKEKSDNLVEENRKESAKIDDTVTGKVDMAKTRSGRAVKRPTHMNDYILRVNNNE